MTAWTSDELRTIADAAELQIAPLGPDGKPRKPVPIWVIRRGDDLYARSYRGTDGSWFRHAQSARQGLIQAGGIGKEVTFADETDPAVNDQIDAAYRAKYSRYGGSYVEPMVSPGARAATVRLVPRLTGIRFCRDRQDIRGATSQPKPVRA
jgi:hypothetical protein